MKKQIFALSLLFVAGVARAEALKVLDTNLMLAYPICGAVQTNGDTDISVAQARARIKMRLYDRNKQVSELEFPVLVGIRTKDAKIVCAGDNSASGKNGIVKLVGVGGEAGGRVGNVIGTYSNDVNGFSSTSSSFDGAVSKHGIRMVDTKQMATNDGSGTLEVTIGAVDESVVTTSDSEDRSWRQISFQTLGVGTAPAVQIPLTMKQILEIEVEEAKESKDSKVVVQ